MVKGPKEERLWKEITPEMMSDKERVGDKYVRHPPSFRSEKVSKFIEKLDSRLVKKGVNATRLARVVGSPRSLPLPSNAKQWIITQSEANGDVTENLSQIEEELEQVEESDSEFSPGSSSAEEEGI